VVTIPGFQEMMLPMLQIASDGLEHSLSQSIEILSNHFGLTNAERQELLPSGRQAKVDNRAGWALTYLAKTNLVQRTGRGKFVITERGIDVLRSNPSRLDLKYLDRFPELERFRSRSNQDNQIEPEDVEEHAPKQTLEEILESSYQNLRRSLSQDLLDLIKTCSPKFFEKLVVDLLVTMGYGGSRKDAGQAIGQSGDDGVDGVIKEDKLGLDVVYVQAKRWDNTVGRPQVQAFAGSLEGLRARKGVLITTSRFSTEAKDYVTRIEKKIVLIDGEQLAQFMIDFGVGVSEVASYTVKKIDLDYFDED
jgi:restriction system protein